MADIEAARRDLVAALDADRVLADPLALRLYARDASMVEGGCALVVFPLTTEDIRSCVRIARAYGLPDRAPRIRHRVGGGRHADGRRARRRHQQDDAHPRDPARGRPRVGGTGPAQPGPVGGARADRVHVCARPIESADVLDRRQRQHERRRTALPGLRRHQRARPRARRGAPRRLGDRASAPKHRRPRATTCVASWSAAKARSASSRACVCASCRSHRPCARCCSISRPSRPARRR